MEIVYNTMTIDEIIFLSACKKPIHTHTDFLQVSRLAFPNTNRTDP